MENIRRKNNAYNGRFSATTMVSNLLHNMYTIYSLWYNADKKSYCRK